MTRQLSLRDGGVVAFSWRIVQPKLDQVVVVLMRNDDVQLWLAPLSLRYADHQGWRVDVSVTVGRSISKWRWRLSVK